MKITEAKGLAVKGFIGAVAMGTLLFAGNAQAQRFAVGVQFGAPAYVAPAPAYVAPGPAYVAPAPMYAAPAPPFYYGPRRDVFVRHDRWEPARGFDHRFDGDRRWR